MTQAKKHKILNTWNTWDGKIGVSYLHDGERKMIEISVDWYFVILKKDETLAKEILSTTEHIAHFKDENIESPYIKIYCKREAGGSIAKKFEESGITTFEADLMPDKRWFIDRSIEVAGEYKKLYFDIETDDTQEKIVIGQERILSFGAIDNDGKKYFIILKEMTDEAEKEMLGKILRLINKFDMVIGWNSSDFDIPYLRLRMVKYGLHKTKDYRWKQLARYDLLKRFRHIFRFDNHLKKFNLDFISNYFLGKGKVDHKGEKIIDLYNNDKEKLKKYNLEDCILVKELDEKLGVSDMMIRQCQWCGVPAGQFGLYSIIDSYILKMAHSIGKFGKTSIKAIEERNSYNERGNMNPNDTETEKSKYLGAIVLEPKVGMYGKVYVFDFKSLYPSMMITSNIGYDSLRYEADDNSIINPGTTEIPRRDLVIKPTYFTKEPSVINLAITNLLKKRTEYKNLKLKMIGEGTNHGPTWDSVVSDEIIVKELSNSTYGIMGLEYGRYYDVDIAESITLFGQWMILYTQKYFDSIGYNVIYGDTDSVFVETGGREMDLEMELEKYHEVLKKELKEKYNIENSIIQLNFDKQYESLILIAKKSYTGHVVNIEGKKTNDIYARGLEFVKKNTFSFASVKQKELVDMLLHGKIKTAEECIEWRKNTKYEFNIRDFTKEELTLTQKVGKPIKEYTGKTPPLHVRLAKVLQDKTNQVFTNVEIDYIITSGEKGMQGVLAEDFDGTFDREYYWSNKTQPILERITKIAFPGIEIFEPEIKKVRVKKEKKTSITNENQLTLF